jgi:hypothetical protein
MKRILALLLSLVGLANGADSIITATITVTNFSGIATNGTDYVNVNGDTRIATNIISSNPSQLFYGTNSMTKGATNFYSHVALYPFGNGASRLLLYWNSTNSVKLTANRNQALAVTIGGVWGTVTFATNNLTNQVVLTIPASTWPAGGQTNVGSELTYWLNKASNAIAPDSVALTNFLGLTNVQTTGSKTITNSVLEKSRGTNLFGLHGSVHALTNGYYTNSRIDKAFFTNATHYGSAFSSRPNSSSSGEQFGLGADVTNAISGGLAVGGNALAANYFPVAIGNSSVSTGGYSIAIGYTATAGGGGFGANGGIALGAYSIASELKSIAIGTDSQATHLNSIAIGTAVTTQKTNEIRLGGFQDVIVGGRLDVSGELTNNSVRFTGGTITNISAAFINFTATNGAFHSLLATNAHIQAVSLVATNSTNYGGYSTNMRVDRAFATNLTAAGNLTIAGAEANPRYDISTLANGNNIAVPVGSNNYVRLSGTLSAVASICGIVGSGTAGGTDGQWLLVENDTGYTVTFAQNTVDPVVANRIVTLTGADVSCANGGWARLVYDSSESRWKLFAVWPVTAQATNALASIWTNGVAVSGSVTNLNFIYGSNMVIRTTNTSGNVDVHLSSSAGGSSQTNQTVVFSVPLQVQSAWRPSTNMALLEAGYAQWELLFPRTNSAGAAVDLQARWQFNTPTNYVTNTLSIGIYSMLSYTNGPNSSNAIWKATVLRHNTVGSQVSTNDARVGPFDAGTSQFTTIWPANYQGTNKVQFTAITITNCTMAAGESGLLKLERMNTVDGTLQTLNLVDLKLQCDTR